MNPKFKRPCLMGAALRVAYLRRSAKMVLGRRCKVMPVRDNLSLVEFLMRYLWLLLFFIFVASTSHAQERGPEIILGTDEFIEFDLNQISGTEELIASGPVTVRYNNADIHAVVEDLIGTVLQLDYTIAPDVRAQISLRMTEVETRSGVLQRLRAALDAVNIAMIDRGDFIAFVRGGGGQSANVALIRPGEAVSTGTSVAALIFEGATPSSISPILSALHPGIAIQLSDDSRNLLIITGEPAALTAASESAERLDIDYLSSISTGIFPLQFASPIDIAAELPQLIRLPTEAFEVIPVERLELLIVFANDSEVLQRARHWIERLDQPRSARSSPGRYIFTARHTDAVELVEAFYSVMGESALGQRSGSQHSEDSLLDNIRIGAAPDQNIVLIRGNDADVGLVVEMLEMLDRPRPQVLIRAVIAEVTLTNENRFGIDWAGLFDGRVEVGLSDDVSGGASARFPGASVVYTNVDIDVALNVLASDARLEVISRPSILTLHNESAELQVGDQVPVVVQSAQAVNDPGAPIVNQTTYRDTGILLGVTPQIRAGGLVEIAITQEVSNVLNTTSSGIDSPTITQRRLATNLLVPSGETVALGGLISTRTASDGRGVPVLGRAPLIGRAFRSEGQTNDRTELVILLTPTIIVDPAGVAIGELAMADALMRLRDRALSNQ